MSSNAESSTAPSSDDSPIQSPLSYPSATIAEASIRDASHLKIAGGSGTGKTEALIQRANYFIANGTNASDICIITNTVDAAKALSKRLTNAETKAKDVTVTTIQKVCTSILKTNDAQAFNGRNPRLLTKAEYNFLLEDIKTLGQKPGRLKKMLHYFYYQWSQLEPESDWLLPAEEAGVRTALDEHLRSREAMIEEEVSPLTVEYLLNAQEKGADKPFSIILVDDYQNLSKASQTVCSLLARDCLTITGNENQFSEIFDNHPYCKGFVDFEQTFEQAQCVQLNLNVRCPSNIAQAGNVLCSKGDMITQRSVTISENTPPSESVHIKWQIPNEEFPGLIAYIRKLLAQNEELDASDIFIVAPNKTWARTLEKSCARYKLSTSTVLPGQPLTGDPRSLEKSQDLLAFTKLNLLANQSDVVAWRSWCGFDDYLCYASAWCRLKEWSDQQGLSIIEGLTALGNETEEPFLQANILTKRFSEGLDYIEANKTKKGYALVKALATSKVSESFAALLEPMEGDETAEQLFAKAIDNVLNPQFNDLPRTIKIGSYESLQGLGPKVLIISGLIDGFMPNRECFDVAILEKDREDSCNKQRRLFYNAITKAQGRTVFSTLQKSDLELAEKLKMEVRRVKMERGERMAMLSPSIFIAESGDTLPGAVSGQQFMSEI